jgi:hypothetical protein
MGVNQNYSQELGLYSKHENRIGPQPWEKRTSPGERHERTSPQPWKKWTSKSNLENLGLRAGNGQGQIGLVQIEGGPKTLKGGKPDQYRGTDQSGAAWRNREEKYLVAKIKLHFRLK